MKFPKLKAIFRVQAYFGIIAGIVLVAKLGQAYRASEQTLKELGGQLSDYLALPVDGIEAISLNGERFAFVSTMTKKPVDQVLDIAEKACAENSGNIVQELGPILEHVKRNQPEAGVIEPGKLTTLRRDGRTANKGGDVTCLTRPREDGKNAQHPGFIKRIERFTETFALGELGEAHYLRADYEAGPKQTHIVYIRSLGQLSLEHFFAGPGDAPGADPRGVPRPPHSVRILSAAVERTGDGFYAYESPETPNAALNYYDQQLAKTWQKMDLNEKDAPERALDRAYAQGDRALYVVTEPTSDGGSSVGLIALGRSNSSSVTVSR
jgi:hypothetical protein